MFSIWIPPRVDWMKTHWPTSQNISGDDRQGSYAEAPALLMSPTMDATENGASRELSAP